MMFVAFSNVLTAQQIKKSKTSTSTVVVAPPPSTVPLKKDGTPDKRFKVNKAGAAAPVKPLKKDGTPDKRFKANKKG